MTIVLDVNGARLRVGDRVAFGGRVVSINDPDGDVDGETGYVVGINPRVTVWWEDPYNSTHEEEEQFYTHGGRHVEQYHCDDLISLETAT